jgi:hypothetical protein
MKLLTLLILLVSAGGALATNYDGGDCRGNCAPDTPVAPASYDQDQGQTQGQNQGQAQGQLQGQLQGQGQAQSATAVAGAAAGAFNANDIDVRNANHNANLNANDIDVRNANTSVVGVGVDTRDTNVVGVSTNDYNSNSNRAEGGTGIGIGGHQSQGISDSGNSTNSNNSSAVNQGNNAAQSTIVAFEAPKTYRHTPSMGAPSIYASGVCSGRSAGLGLAGPGYGVSLGGTGKNDAGCELRETARLLGGLGYTDTAFVLLCQQLDTVREANGGNCTPPQDEPPVVVDPPVDNDPPVVIVDDVKG